MTLSSRALVRLLASTSILGVAPAYAQTAAEQLAAAEAAPVAGDIVVTATRRETTVQNTPMVVNAIGNDTLLKTNAKSIGDIAAQIPALTVQDQGPGQKRYTIRNITAAGEPQVGLYLDEIPIVGFTGENTSAGSQQPDVKLWDMQRVEVLQGPQGTLYGAGSEGGTIRIISARPDLTKYAGVVNGTISSTASGGTNTSINGTLNVPIISDKLAIRVNAYSDHDAGWIDEYYLQKKNTNSVRNWGGRFNLRAKPVDNWTIDFIAYYQKTHFGNLFNMNEDFAGIAGTKWVAANFVNQPGDDKFQAYNFVTSYNMPWATLTATASYQHRTLVNHKDSVVTHTFSCADRDYVSCQPIDAVRARLAAGSLRALRDYNDVKGYSGELRLSSVGSGPLQWTVGAFYQQRKNKFQLLSGLADSDGNYDGEPSRTKFARANQDDTKQIAGFGEVSYKLTDTLTATAGVRVFHVSRALDSQSLSASGDTFVVGTSYPTSNYKESSKTLKFLINWKPTSDLLLYAQAAQGFRLGGPNLPLGLTIDIPPPYKSDSLWDYEAGFKSSWWGNRMTLNGAFYYMKWSDIQAQGTDVTGAYSFITNAGAARAIGGELELTARPTSFLNLNLGGSYTDAKLVGDQPFQPLAINKLVAGDPLPYTPKWTINASAEVNYTIGSMPGFVRGEFSYQSGRTTAFDPVSPAYTELPGWELVNVSAGLTIAERYQVTLFVRNLFNAVTYVSGSYNAQTPVAINSAAPRTVGATLNISL
ncbi:TonB-dependent receptor [Flavisphingomonas formosensis]|uniref:TonB-dependent receptor n=1 Tax=Flavisphingomonas formosensis TaxID=861534 RepID=UPI0012FC323F|nr:TonB-dependent receptor [Sphingomonas formosensis]